MNARSVRWVLFAAAVSLPFAASVRTATAADDEPAPTLSEVKVHDGSTWVPLELHTGNVDRPEGASAAAATLRSQLGGPKTYFVVPDAASGQVVSIARPRFQLKTDAGTVRRIQLAILEVQDEARRTPVERVKGLTVFKRGVELEAKEMREGVWELRPKKSLQPGEYALVLGEDGPIADFTIAPRGY